jgi:phage protein D
MATAPQQIYKGRDLWVPAFDVKIRAKEIPSISSKDIIAVKYTDAIDKIDSFELTVNNWDAGTRDFKYTGSASGKNDGPATHLFDPGQEIELSMGYWKPTDPKQRDPNKPDPLRLMLAGIITSMTPSFPATGQPTLKVTGQNVLRALLTKQQTRIYENKSDSQIAKEIGSKGELKIGDITVDVEIDSEAQSQEAVHDHVMQDGQYDILFLLQRAHRNGYDVVLKYKSKGGKTTPSLYFGPSSKDARASYQLEWGRSLMQFQPTLTTTHQVSKVTVRYWDGVKKKPVSVTVDRKQLNTKGLRDQATLDRMEQGFHEREDVITDQPFRDKKAATQYAKDRLERIAQDFVTARGSTFGTPDLRAGSVAEITGLGKTFTGRYFVTSTTHNLGVGGYVTEFEARLEEENK